MSVIKLSRWVVIMLILLGPSAFAAHMSMEGDDWDTLAFENEIRSFDGTGEETI